MVSATLKTYMKKVQIAKNQLDTAIKAKKIANLREKKYLSTRVKELNQSLAQINAGLLKTKDPLKRKRLMIAREQTKQLLRRANKFL